MDNLIDELYQDDVLKSLKDLCSNDLLFILAQKHGTKLTATEVRRLSSINQLPQHQRESELDSVISSLAEKVTKTESKVKRITF